MGFGIAVDAEQKSFRFDPHHRTRRASSCNSEAPSSNALRSKSLTFIAAHA